MLTEAKGLNCADALAKAAAEWSRIKKTPAASMYHLEAKASVVPDPATLAGDEKTRYMNRLYQKMSDLVIIFVSHSSILLLSFSHCVLLILIPYSFCMQAKCEVTNYFN